MISIFACFNSFGQAPRGFYGKTFINESTFKSNDILSDPALGYGVGVNFNCGYHESYNYQIEITYSKADVNFKGIDASYQNVYNSKQSYEGIQTGFYFNYYIVKPDENKFFIGLQVGISFTYGGYFKPVHDSGDEYYLPYLVNNTNLSLNPPSVSTNAGLGLTGGYNKFRFDLRYDMGLTNLLNGTQTNSYDESHNYTGKSLMGKLNTISFGISYKLFFFSK